MNITPVRIYINGNGSISFFGANNSLITNLQNLNGAKASDGQITFTGDDKTISFYVYQLTAIESATFSLPYSVLDSRFFNPSTYSAKLNQVYQDVAEYVLVNKNGGASFVGGVVAVYPNYASFPATGQEAVIYIDEGTNQAYFWDGSTYQLLVSTGVEQYATFASFPVTGSANVIYVDMSVPTPYVWNGTAYESIGSAAVWGGITGTLSAQTDLQAALDAKFDDPTGTTAEYIRGDGTLATFPSIPSIAGLVPETRTLTINGSTQDLSANRTWSVGDMLKSVYDTDVDGVVDSAERIQIVVRNSTGSTLTKGQIVYLSGATGNRPNAVLAQANTEATSSKTIGMVIADIPNNTDGQVAVNGTLHDLDTATFAAGDTLWLSATTPGGVVANTPPSEPNHTVFIGYVARANPTQGRVVLAIQNGYELDELHGVQITTPTNWQVLRYNSTSGLWVNELIPASILPGGIDASKIGAGTVDNTEFGYLNGVTSSIQTQLNAKQDSLVSGTNIKTIEGQSLLGAGNIDLTKSDVGLSNVDNTSDINKPISTATQTALNLKENSANKQNSLAIDGTGVKFPTVDAVNTQSMIDKGRGMVSFFTDFVGNSVAIDGCVPLTSGGIISQQALSVPGQKTNQQGVHSLSTSTAATNWANHISSSVTSFGLGVGSWVYETSFNMSNLSVLTDRFRFVSGFCSANGSVVETDGVFFTYDEGGTANGTAASPNWQCVTVANSVRTLTTTSTIFTNQVWHKLRIEINAAGTQALFYLNGTLIATHTTNIPLYSNSRFVMAKQGIFKVLGTTNRVMFVDYWGYENILTTPR